MPEELPLPVEEALLAGYYYEDADGTLTLLRYPTAPRGTDPADIPAPADPPAAISNDAVEEG